MTTTLKVYSKLTDALAAFFADTGRERLQQGGYMRVTADNGDVTWYRVVQSFTDLEFLRGFRADNLVFHGVEPSLETEITRMVRG